MKEFNFYQITDLHLYSKEKIGACGKAFEQKAKLDQKCMEESCAIIDAAFKKVIDDKENEVIVLTGDLTFDGEVLNHEVVKEKIQALKDAGKKVYVTFATHDWNMKALGYNEQGSYPLPKFTREELREFYNDFGWSDAYSEHVPSYSYAVKPYEGVVFLMLNDDGDGLEHCGYDEDLMNWIEARCVEAKANGETVFAFTHHPALPPAVLYPIYSHRDMLSNYEYVVPKFADWGIKCIFTGHTHMQSVSSLETYKGNKIYHVNTGSIIAYPAPIRRMVVTDDGIDVKTLSIDSFDWDLGGKTVRQYMKDHFLFMLNDIFYSLANDIEHFKTLAPSFSMSPEMVDRFKPIFILIGKFLNGLTFKNAGRALLVKKQVDPSIEDIKIINFALDLVVRLYDGERNYAPDTVEHKAMMAVVKKLGKHIEFKDSVGDITFLEEIVEDLLFDTGSLDNNNCYLKF